MKAFTNLRRGIGTFCKPRARDSRHAKNESIRHDIEEALRQNDAPSKLSQDSDAPFANAQSTVGSVGAGVQPSVADVAEASPLSTLGLPPVSEVARDDRTGAEQALEDPIVGPTYLEEAVSVEPDQTPEETPALANSGDAQTLRNDRYIGFEGEDESDYTEGPARFVFGTDGVKECATLLMTLELSRSIQATVHAQRAYATAERQTLEHRKAFMRLEGKIGVKISSCRARLAALQTDPETGEKTVADLQQHLEILMLLLDETKGRRQLVHTQLSAQADQLRRTQAAANGIIEEALVCGCLLEPEGPPLDESIQPLDLDAEYAAFCEKLKDAYEEDGEYTAPPLDVSDRPEEVLMQTEEDKARQSIVERFWAAKDALHQAHKDFEGREVTRAREFQANADAANRGEPTTDDSPEAFDIRWVKRNQELTRAVVDAEAVFAAAKAEIREASIELPPEDQTSVLYDRADDGYRMSFEQDLVGSIPSPVVKHWMSAIPGDAAEGIRSPAEVDEWDAEEVGISDSVSLVAEGSERRRIDRWRPLCGV